MATNYLKLLKRFFVIGMEVLVLGLIAYFTENHLFLYLIPLLEVFRKWFKHREKKIFPVVLEKENE